jgi:hypothetical protein
LVAIVTEPNYTTEGNVMSYQGSSGSGNQYAGKYGSGNPRDGGCLRVAAAIVVAAVLAVLFTAAPASAGSGPAINDGKSNANARVASQTLVGRWPLGNSAEMDLYWDGYQNTAYVKHLGSLYGVPAAGNVQICRSNASGYCTGPLAEDPGTYRYYNGPVRSGPSAHTCVSVWGSITYGGNTFRFYVPATACG